MTTMTPLPPVADRPAAPPASSRPTPASTGLVVLALPPEAIPIAGALLRPGPALALVAVPPDPLMIPAMVERAAEAVLAAGFDLQAVETIPADGLHARFTALRDEHVAGAVVSGASARRVRRLTHALGAPVLALPDNPLAAGGPAVLDAHDAAWAVPAIARCLATRDAVAVAELDGTSTATLMRSAAHPLLVPRLEEVAELKRWDELDDIQRGIDLAFAVAEEHGVAIDPEITEREEPLLATARERDGIVVVPDGGGWRAPGVLRRALRERRPALLVPPG